jgi:parallel beta-helix repeat protein
MNKIIFFAAIMICVLIPTLSVPSKAQTGQTIGAIYITADGNIDPRTANITTADNSTYYFTDNNYGGIVVEKSNIVIDGAGYTLQGNGSGYGISLTQINNVTIRNTIITRFRCAILLNSSYDNTLSDNNMTGNVLTSNPYAFGGHDCGGVYLESSNNNRLSANSIIENGGILISVDGICLTSSSYNTMSSNTISENNGAGITIDDSSTHNTVSNNNISENRHYGIDLWLDSSNTISNNSVSGNGAGILLESASNDTVSDNNITKGRITGMEETGIELDMWCSNDTVLGNNIAGYSIGVYFSQSSHDNMVLGNNITKNGLGIHIGSSIGACWNNVIYHNNFLDNGEQVALSGYEPNVWDGGYIRGGNYWSDYNGTDSYGGPYQNETGLDWIEDTPYTIDQINIDRYPLMYPFVPDVDSVEIAYRSLLVNYDNLQTGLNALNETNQRQLSDYLELQENCTSLQKNYNSLNSSYTNLNTTLNQYKESTQDELSYLRNFVYILTATTAILTLAAVYFAVRKREKKIKLYPNQHH